MDIVLILTALGVIIPGITFGWSRWQTHLNNDYLCKLKPWKTQFVHDGWWFTLCVNTHNKGKQPAYYSARGVNITNAQGEKLSIQMEKKSEDGLAPDRQNSVIYFTFRHTGKITLYEECENRGAKKYLLLLDVKFGKHQKPRRDEVSGEIVYEKIMKGEETCADRRI